MVPNSLWQAISVAITYMFIGLALQTMNGLILEIQVFEMNLSSVFGLNVVIGNVTTENKLMDSECKVLVSCGRNVCLFMSSLTKKNPDQNNSLNYH